MSNEIKLLIDYSSIIPVYEQIKQFFKMQILNNSIKAEEKITSVRELARTIKVNQNTIVKAYYQLELQGFIYSKPGKGYFVKSIIIDASKEKKEVLQNTIKSFLEQTTNLGYSINDVIAELKEYSKES